MVRFAAPLAFIGAATALSLAATPALAADGAQLFAMQCKLCHQPAGSTAMAPSLAGVAGSKIASKSDFSYSPALKAHGGVWTDDNLQAFLKSPAAFAPGTKMMISVPSDENRAALVGYLKTLK
jgi:cytochrome c